MPDLSLKPANPRGAAGWRWKRLALIGVAAGLMPLAVPVVASADNGGDHVDGWSAAAAAALAAGGAGALAAGAARRPTKPKPNIELTMGEPRILPNIEFTMGEPRILPNIEFTMGEPRILPPDAGQPPGGQGGGRR